MYPTENNTHSGAAEFEERNDGKPPHVVIIMPDTPPQSILKPKSNAFWTKKRIVCVVMAILVLIGCGVGGAIWYFYPREKESTSTSSSMHATPEKKPSLLPTKKEEQAKPPLTPTSPGSLHKKPRDLRQTRRSDAAAKLERAPAPGKAPSSLLPATSLLPTTKEKKEDEEARLNGAQKAKAKSSLAATPGNVTPLSLTATPGDFGEQRRSDAPASLTATSSGSLHESHEPDAKSLFPSPPEGELPQQPMPMPGIRQRAMETENAEAMKPSSTCTVAEAKNLLSSYQTQLGWQKELIFGGEDGDKVFIDMVHAVKIDQQTWKARKEIDFSDAADMGTKLNELVSVFHMTFDAIKFDHEETRDDAIYTKEFFESVHKMLKPGGNFIFPVTSNLGGDATFRNRIKDDLVSAGFPKHLILMGNADWDCKKDYKK